MTQQIDERLNERLKIFLSLKKDIVVRVSGISMLPFIKEDDVVKAEYVSSEEIRIGDIVLFRINNSLIVHRVVRFIKSKNNIKEILQCGDNFFEFSPIETKFLLGRVVEVLTKNHVYIFSDKGCRFVNRTVGICENFLYMFTIRHPLLKKMLLPRIFNKLLRIIAKILIKLAYIFFRHFIMRERKKT